MKNLAMIGVGILVILAVLLCGCCSCIPTDNPTATPTEENTATYTPSNAASDQTMNTRVSQAGGASGDPQITLVWDNTNDLDIHCVTPAGDEIYYNNPEADGGVLDVDRNAFTSDLTSTPVENIVWQPGTAPSGHYTVSVVYYAQHDDQLATPYTVRVIVNGQEHVFTSTATTVDDRQNIYDFTI